MLDWFESFWYLIVFPAVGWVVSIERRLTSIKKDSDREDFRAFISEYKTDIREIRKDIKSLLTR